jgi:uncharacterized protein (TIGR03067 family)
MNEGKPAHPSLNQLVAFGQGRLSEAELADLSDHLSACAECLEKVEASGDDTLISLLRSASTEHDQDATPDPREVPTLAPAVEPGMTADLPGELVHHNRYRIQELLGVGGMGAVYKAEHLLMERPVALKVINRELTKNPDTVERFRREVKAAARLTHPNIVHAYDAEQAGDLHFLVMEYIDGKSLARVVAEHGPLPIKQACEYIRQATLGLQYAHEQGMVHRDIKPQNLMLLASGGRKPADSGSGGLRPPLAKTVKILDFGLARFALETASTEGRLSTSPSVPAADSAATQSITQTGTIMGTPDYIAPEQARDAHTADIRADIYSLGCTLYHLLAGQPPYPEGTVVDKIMAHTERPPKPLTELRRDMPPRLAHVIERMMAKDPAKRYQKPAEIAAALQPFVAKSAIKPRQVIRRWLAAACALVILAALAAGVVIYVQTEKGEFVIKTDDSNVTVKVNQKGIKIRDEKSGREYLLKAGANEVRPGQYQIVGTELPDGVQVEGETFTVKRHGQVIVTAKLRSAKSDQEKMQGTWRGVSASVQGQRMPDEIIKAVGPAITIAGNKLTWKANPTPDAKDLFGGVLATFRLEGILHLDPTKSPKTVDLTVLGQNPKTPLGTPAPRALLGIYRLDGDTLELCIAVDPEHPEERPAKFESVPGKFIAHVTLKRETATAPPKGRLINSFGLGFRPITRDGITEDDGAWKIDATRERFVRLYEVKPPVEECVIYVRAKMKSSNLQGRAYLEMWSRMPLGGEYFSKGLTSTVMGTTDWKSVEIPFFLQKDERPDLLKLGIEIEPNASRERVESPETVWIKDIELWQAPLPAEMRRPSAVVRPGAPGEFGTLHTVKPWHIERLKSDSLILDEFSLAKKPEPADGYLLTLRAQMKVSDLQGKAYLWMVGRFPDNTEKELGSDVPTHLTGTTDWASLETSLPIQKGQRPPDKLTLKVVIQGKGAVDIKDIELLRGPLPK